MALPRVQPRMTVEDRVDREAHPAPTKLQTAPGDAQERDEVHWTTKVALVALAVFTIASTASGAFLGFTWAGLLGAIGYGALGLSMASLVVFYVMGSD